MDSMGALLTCGRLDVVHVLPDSHSDGAFIVSKGRAFCKIHQAEFDSNIVIEIRNDILEETDCPLLHSDLQALHGSRLALPRCVDDRRRTEFIERRHESE
jgi:putative restriction endonuclease